MGVVLVPQNMHVRPDDEFVDFGAGAVGAGAAGVGATTSSASLVAGITESVDWVVEERSDSESVGVVTVDDFEAGWTVVVVIVG
jgi:hypothetical protein